MKTNKKANDRRMENKMTESHIPTTIHYKKLTNEQQTTTNLTKNKLKNT